MPIIHVIFQPNIKQKGKKKKEKKEKKKSFQQSKTYKIVVEEFVELSLERCNF